MNRILLFAVPALALACSPAPDNDDVTDPVDTLEDTVDTLGDSDGDAPEDTDVACPDADDDGVCDDEDLCEGDDATGDADADGQCDDVDLCLGDDTSEDADGDGICGDLDECTGDDALGDSDNDGSCDDLDLCSGDDRSGDSDGDGVCNDVDDLVLHMPFDGVLTDVGSGFGTMDSTAVYTDDVDGNTDSALSATGCANYTVSYTASAGHSFSVWLRPHEALDESTSRKVFAAFSWGGWQHYYQDGSWTFELYNDSPRYPTFHNIEATEAANEWVHLVVAVDGTTATMWRNGVEMASENAPPEQVEGTSGTVSVGCSGDHFDIDDHRVYSRGLSNADVQWLYTLGQPVLP